MTHLCIGWTNVADGQTSWLDKCQVGQMSIGQMSIIQTLVGQMSVAQMLVAQTSVAQNSRHPVETFLLAQTEYLFKLANGF
jgi:hypothetical protein